MKIFERVEAKKKQVKVDANAGKDNAGKAIAAILGGAESPEWETYMKQFIDVDGNGVPTNPAQLRRLLGQDNKATDAAMRERRAYLVANAVCGQGTGDGLTNKVDTIDDGIA